MNLFDIQSWWEIPSIAHFCSLFRAPFELPDFDIVDLEQALLDDATDTTTDPNATQPQLLTDLVVRLVAGTKAGSKPKPYRPFHGVTASNFEKLMRPLLHQHCKTLKHENPYKENVPFESLPAHAKVRILQRLCDIRLDAEDVPSIFAKLASESLRVDPLGQDSRGATYWCFDGTRLYREDPAPIRVHKILTASAKKSTQSTSGAAGWHLVCQTPDDWNHFVAQLAPTSHSGELALFRTLCDELLPNVQSIYTQQEQLRRKRHILANIRRSSRVPKRKLSHGEPSTSRSTTGSPVSEINDEEERNRRYPGRVQRKQRNRLTL